MLRRRRREARLVLPVRGLPVLRPLTGMHALVDMWIAGGESDVWTSEETTDPLTLAARALELDGAIVGMTVYVYDASEECVARWHWRRPLKTCGCGRAYDAADWARLPFVSHVHTPADDEGPAETIELRNCACGSTISVLVPGGR